MKSASYKKSLILAVILHLILIVGLFIHFIPKMELGPGPEVKIINATVVNVGRVQHPSARITSVHKEITRPAIVKPIPPDVTQQDQAEKKLVAEKVAAEQQEKALQVAKLAAQKAEEEKQALLAEQKAAEEKQEKLKQEKLAKLAQQKAQQVALAKRKAEQQKRQQLAQQLKAAQQQMLQQQLAQEQNQLAAASAAAANNAKIQSEIDKYKALILQAIGQNWLIPDNVDKTLSCILLIQLAPDGTVLGVQISKSSGNSGLDQSATSAVFKASPLPVPSDPQVFDKFRNLRLTVRPEDITN